MPETTYYWQGGRKIAIEQKRDIVTIEKATVDGALEAAESAGVEISEAAPVAQNMVRLRVRGSRDVSMDALRNDNNIVHHVYNTLNNPANEIIITETFHLHFKDGVSDAEKQAIVQREHLDIVQKISDKTWLVKVTNATGSNPLKVANRLAEDDKVKAAEPNIVHALQRFDDSPITDMLFPEQWHLHTPSDGIDLVKGAGIQALDAWQTTRGDRRIVVCVADDGFDLTHPDLKGDGKVVDRINIILVGQGEIGSNTSVTPRAGDYHGTPCAGVAIGEANNQGVMGVAPGCAFLPLRFPLSLTDEQLAQMFELVSPKADVISCSWGYGPADQPMSTRLKEAIDNLATTGGRRGKGLIFCVAAGNNNCPVKDTGNTRSYQFLDRNENLRTHTGPIDRWIAAHPKVITVSASTSLKTRAAYSSWGKEIAVCAPSNNFHDLGFFQPRGLGIVTTDNEGFGAGSDFDQGSRFTSRFGGTSSATPTVAGVCALVLSANSELTAADVKMIVEESADRDLTIASETPVNEPGNFVGGFSLWFGHGKVNARAAVARASAARMPVQP